MVHAERTRENEISKKGRAILFIVRVCCLDSQRPAGVLGISMPLQKTLGVESGHTAASGGCDGLAVFFILHVTGGKHAGNGSLGGARFGDDVPLLIAADLAL